jgi:CheY-like chemotaxis protein
VHSLLPDLVVLDIRMPGIDGATVCRSIKTDPATRHVKVLVMTAYATDENVRHLRGLGADDFLQKPFDAAALLHKVQRLIGEP